MLARRGSSARLSSVVEPEREPAHITPDFERFSQVNDVFTRSRWDETIRNASWHVADIFAEMFEGDDRRDGFLDPLSMLRDGASEKVDVGPPAQASRELRRLG